MAHVLPVLSRDGEKRGEVTLSAALFGVEPNKRVMHQAVQAYLANQRVTTAMKKTRAEVSGGGRKPWRQKHTGRARSGSTRVPQWRHGGLAFAPKPRDVSQRIPKKVKRLALLSALSVKAADGRITIVEDFELAEVSTKEMAAILKDLGVGRGNTLLVYKDADEKLRLSARNIANLRLARPEGLTTYELLHADLVVMTRSALARVEEVFGA